MSPSDKEPVVIVGANLAGLSFAGTLRAGGYDGPLTLIDAETEPSIDRPPLSKGFLKDGDIDRIRLDTSRLQNATWLRGVRVLSIDTRARRLHLSQGGPVHWGTLVLATGARPRTLPGLDAIERPVFTLRGLADAQALRAWLQPGRRLLLVGAGPIGLELAATARELGAEVTVLEAQDRVMARSAPVSLSRFIERRHRQAGVDLRLGRRTTRVEPGAVWLDDGSRIEVDGVVVGIGVQPNDALAQACGIRCEDGVVVDAHGHTSEPGILAVGDVSRQPHPIRGELERIETWSNAQNQAAAAARHWLDATTPPYTDAPWYWSDQYELRIQAVGLPSGPTEVLRGNPDTGKFSLLQLDGERLVGAACVNNAKDFGALRRLVGQVLKATPGQWADPAIDLRKLV
jgi:3-phenylpropionate/trans-cinnamate dioxygenase ferredoxin reductase component